MITVNIRYKGTNGSALDFAWEMIGSGTVDRIRKEIGNLCYEYYQSLEDPEVILLVDSWMDQEAIERHHASGMMEVIMKLREKYDLHMEAVRFREDEGIPETDQAFIRQ